MAAETTVAAAAVSGNLFARPSRPFLPVAPPLGSLPRVAPFGDSGARSAIAPLATTTAAIAAVAPAAALRRGSTSGRKNASVLSSPSFLSPAPVRSPPSLLQPSVRGTNVRLR